MCTYRHLLTIGANVNHRDEDGCTPLHVAAAVHNARGVGIFLLNNADKKAKNNAGKTPVQVARANKKKMQNFLG